VIPLDDVSQFEWIVTGRTPTPHSREVSAASGVPLSCVIPLQFEKYAKILHRLDGHYENIDHPLTEEEIAVLGLPACSVVRDLIVQKRRTSLTSRVSWKEAAGAFGIPYSPLIKHSWFSKRLDPHPECWPRFIYGPADGTLEADESRALVSVLTTVTGDQECYFRLAAMPFIATDQNLLFAGMLNEVEDFFVNGPFQFTPEYWWPRDHLWCVCTDYDLEFTVVGGGAAVIDSLVRNEVFECIEVSSDIRIDYLTPIPQGDLLAP
jgi:hypothetical protein